MYNDLFAMMLTDMIVREANKRGDTYVREGVEIIHKVYDLHDDLGNKLSKVPHEHYPKIISHLNMIEELFKQEVER